MSEMVERVADRLRLCGLERNAEYFARKAIEVMREPTVSLLYAGSAQHADLPFHQTAEIWQAMIDEALK